MHYLHHHWPLHINCTAIFPSEDALEAVQGQTGVWANNFGKSFNKSYCQPLLHCTALHCGDEWIALVVEEVESKSKVESLDSPAATGPLHCPTTDQACNVLLTCSFSYFRQVFFFFEKLQSCIFIHWPLCNLGTFHELHSPRQSEDVFCSLLHTCLFVWQRSFTFSTHSHFHKGAHRDQLTTEQRRSGTSPAIIVYNFTTEMMEQSAEAARKTTTCAKITRQLKSDPQLTVFKRSIKIPPSLVHGPACLILICTYYKCDFNLLGFFYIFHGPWYVCSTILINFFYGSTFKRLAKWFLEHMISLILSK